MNQPKPSCTLENAVPACIMLPKLMVFARYIGSVATTGMKKLTRR